MAAQRGFDDTDPLMEHTDDCNDDDDGDRTKPLRFSLESMEGRRHPVMAKKTPIRTTTTNRSETPSWFPQIPDKLKKR